MTVSEVYAYIDSQIQWTDEEKLGVRSLFQTYVKMVDDQDIEMQERVSRWRKRLVDLGIIV